MDKWTLPQSGGKNDFQLEIITVFHQFKEKRNDGSNSAICKQ